jgi:hypothetical protein
MSPDGFDQQRHRVGDADCLCTLSHPVTLRKPTVQRAVPAARKIALQECSAGQAGQHTGRRQAIALNGGRIDSDAATAVKSERSSLPGRRDHLDHVHA